MCKGCLLLIDCRNDGLLTVIICQQYMACLVDAVIPAEKATWVDISGGGVRETFKGALAIHLGCQQHLPCPGAEEGIAETQSTFAAE